MTGPLSSGNLVSGIVAVESVESVDVIDGTDFEGFEEVMKERNRVSYE
jgi:hypothetical protein